MTATPSPEAAAAFSDASKVKPAGDDADEFRRFRAGFLACWFTFPFPRFQPAGDGTWTTTGKAGETPRAMSYTPAKPLPLDPEEAARAAYAAWVKAGRSW